MQRSQLKQFTSWAFTERARASGLVPSMGTIGDCYDNGMMESFWGRMQTELLTARNGRPASSSPTRSSTTSKSSTTGNAATAPWACSHPTNMKGSAPPCQSHRTSCRGSTEPGEDQILPLAMDMISRTASPGCQYRIKKSTGLRALMAAGRAKWSRPSPWLAAGRRGWLAAGRCW